MTHEERDKRDRTDLQFLLQQQQFARFCWRVIQLARIFDRAADGSHDEAVSGLARRNLGLEILEMVERGQPVSHENGQPILTLLQTLREEANQPQGETNGRRNQYDRNRDLYGDDD